MKKRTKIADITVKGFELADAQLRQVSGGAPPPPHKCWMASASVTQPGQSDNQQDYVTD